MPLNYAILKYFTKTDEACVSDVINALKDNYGNFRAMKKPAVMEALMTAEANGLLEETRFELDENKELLIYYHASEENIETINKYIKD